MGEQPQPTANCCNLDTCSVESRATDPVGAGTWSASHLWRLSTQTLRDRLHPTLMLQTAGRHVARVALIGMFLLRPAMAQDCGDGLPEPPEACDDGNEVDGDGCTDCTVDERYLCASPGEVDLTPFLDEHFGSPGVWIVDAAGTGVTQVLAGWAAEGRASTRVRRKGRSRVFRSRL